MENLTQEQRETLNAAMEIILANTPKSASWLISVSNYHDNPSCSVTYFDSSEFHTQHSGLWEPDCTFADKVQMAISIEANLEITKEQRRAAEVEKLRSRLAALTGEPLAA